MADNIQILNHLKLMLSSKLADRLKQVILFGSQAWGEAREFSDYDILIILDEKPDGKLEKKIADCCYEIDLKYGIFTDVHVAGEEELDDLRGKHPILQAAIDRGIYA